MTDPEFELILNDAAEQRHYEEELARDDRLCEAFRASGIQVKMPTKEESEAAHGPDAVTNSNPEGHNQYTEWYEQAGKTALTKPQAEHDREAGEHRARLAAMTKDELMKVGEAVGHYVGRGTPKGKLVDDLIRRVTDRRGAVQRSIL